MSVNIHKMIKIGNAKAIKKEIKKNKKLLELTNEKGSTILHTAAQEGNVEIVKMLLDLGSAINATDFEKYTPLLEAASQKHFSIVKILLDRGADPSILNTGNSGIIHYLIRNDDEQSKNDLNFQKQLIVQCIKSGANINTKNKFGETPLHQAIMRRSFEMTEFLIEQKADINKINKFGETGLHKAVILKDFDMVKFLLENGADLTIESSRGTARELCDPVEDKNIFDLLIFAESNKVSGERKDIAQRTQRKSRYYDTWQRMKEISGDHTAKEIGPSDGEFPENMSITNLRGNSQRKSSVSIKDSNTYSPESGRRDSDRRDSNNSVSRGSSMTPVKKRSDESGEDVEQESTHISEFYENQTKWEDNDTTMLTEDNQFRIETTGSGNLKDVNLLKITEYYKDGFYEKEHYNFLAVPMNEKQGNYGIISVLTTPDKSDNHKVLYMSKDGYTLLNASVKSLEGKKPLVEKLLKWIQTEIKDFVFSEVYYVESPEIQEELLRIEALAPEKTFCFRVGIVYCKEDQKQEQEMFLNEASPSFIQFLECIGEKIDLMGWGGYRGQLCVTSPGESYYTEWNGLEIMYHVTTMMNAEQQRRLVGNDTAIVYFHESSSQVFNSGAPRSAMSQIFSVVQPRNPSHYKVSFLSRNKIPHYRPHLPKDPTFDVSTKQGRDCFRDFFLTKLVNGYRTAIDSPPLDKMFKRPREAGIKQVCGTFPFKGKAKHKRKPKKK